MNPLAYARPPLRICGEVPVFTETDAYSENYEQIARDHFAAIERGVSNPFIDEEMWQQMEESTLALLRKYSSPGTRVLDVGVGLGRLLSQAPELDRYGFDVSLQYLSEARRKGIDVCCARAEDLPYREEYFDVVICTDVLEHVFDLNQTLKCLLRVLKEKGILIIRVPDRENLSPYLASEYPYRFAHVRSFDEAGLRLLLCRVFDCEFLEKWLVHTHYDVKMKLPLPRHPRWLLTLALNRFTCWNRRLHNWTAKSFFRPLEINVVFRKSSSAIKPADVPQNREKASAC